MERTLMIIKPEAVSQGHVGDIVRFLEQERGFRIIGLRMTRLSPRDAGEFYAIHRERPFYEDLKAYMTSGPVVVIGVEGEGAVVRMREIIGATDPAQADEGPIRRLYAANIQNNAVHGSDSPENGRIETSFFFSSQDFLSLQG